VLSLLDRICSKVRCEAALALALAAAAADEADATTDEAELATLARLAEAPLAGTAAEAEELEELGAGTEVGTGVIWEDWATALAARPTATSRVDSMTA
jgi:hypothetical protein